MKNNKKYQRSKYWCDMTEFLEYLFPNGKSEERGEAMVLISYIEMLLQGKKFKFGKDGEPIILPPEKINKK